MKKIIIMLFTLSFSASVFAQAPELFNYQGVARDLNGHPLPSQTISLQLSILSGSVNGTAEYVEQHTVTTNSLGLFNIQIGAGVLSSGSFATIDWGNDLHFLAVEMDESGGTSYTLLGTSQLVSVPYALHAESGGEWEDDGMGIHSKNRNIAINTQNSNPQRLIEGKKDNSSLWVRMGNGNGSSSYGANFTYGSQVFIGTDDQNAAAGFVFDAMDGDGIGVDYGTLYQYDDGKIELNSRGNHDLIFATNNQERMIITNSGEVYLPNSTEGIIMTSPSGTCWKLTVDNAGQPVFTSITCPN